MMMPEPLLAPLDDKEPEVSSICQVLTCLTILDRHRLQIVGTASATSVQGTTLLAYGWSLTHIRNPVGPALGTNWFV